jgi:hypothetical protein
VFEDQYKALSPDLQGVEPTADPFQGVPSNRLEAALHYTRAGLKIFPCEPGSKRPARWTHGFKDATTEIRPLDNPRLKHLGWFDFILPDGTELTVTPRDNWGFEPGQWGFTVVDIDPKNGGDASWAALIAEHGPIVTREVRTPSGGQHLYFRGTSAAVNKKLGPGIDTRCFGGYVLLPPSSVKGLPYAWVDETVPIAPLPEWAREILEAQDTTTYDVDGDTAFAEWQEAGGEGGRFEFLLSRIGDEASGGDGFYNPMLSAAGYGASRFDMEVDEVVARIEEAALAAPRGKRTLSYVKAKIAELRPTIRKFRRQDQAQAEERKAFEEAEAEIAEQEEEVAEEPRPFSGSSEWMSPEEAIASLRTPIRTWLDRDSTHQKMLTILQSAARLGKTLTMLEEQQHAERKDRHRAEKEAQSEVAKQQRIVDGLWESYLAALPHDDPERLHQIEAELEGQQHRLIGILLEEDLADLPPPPLGKLACASPRQKLAQEIQKVDRELRHVAGYDGEEIPVLQGRNASNCQRYELVDKAEKKGFEPSACCRTWVNGVEQRCPFFEKCSTDPTQYLANQPEVKEADNIIIMHSHLAIPWLDSLALSSRKRVWIDEAPSNTFKFNQVVSDDYLTELLTDCDFALQKLEQEPEVLEDIELVETDKGKKWKENQRRNIECLAELSRNLLTGLLPPGRLQIERHLAGWTPTALRRIGRLREAIERLRRGKPLNPSLSNNTLSEQLDKVGTPPRKLASLFYRLADELEARGKGEIYSLGRNHQGKITIRGRKPTDNLPPNLLLTDATPSPEILAAVFAGHEQELIEIPVRRSAFITQTSEPVFSRNWLLEKKHLPEVVDWIKRIAPLYRNLAVLTTKRIRCAMTGEDPSPGAKLPVFFEIHGARIGHYGNLRGSNEFADCDALVILGREQPDAEDMEEVAKAIWYDTDKPLRLVKPVNGNKYYLKVTRPYLMRDGSSRHGEVMVHPDVRVQAVLTATREH